MHGIFDRFQLGDFLGGYSWGIFNGLFSALCWGGNRPTQVLHWIFLPLLSLHPRPAGTDDRMWQVIMCRQLQPSQWNTILTPWVQGQYHVAGTVGIYLTPVKEQSLAIAIDKQNNLWFTVFLFFLECLEYWYLQTSDYFIFLLEAYKPSQGGVWHETDGPRLVLYQL